MTVLYILNEDISIYEKKGEIIDNYYNPKTFFNKVIFVILDKKRGNISQNTIEKLVGKNVAYKIYYIDFNLKTFIKNILLLNGNNYLSYYENKILELNLEFDLIRAVGQGFNFYFANRLANKLNKPYILSLHNQFDELKKIENKSIKKRVINYLIEKYSIKSLKEANQVIGVYSPIEWYVNKIGVKNYQTIYNIINPKSITKKMDYKIKNKFKIITIGRQIIGRDISNFIKAIAKINNIEFLVIGDGEFHHQLISLSKQLDIYNKKVFFIKSLPNDEICKILPDYDLYVAHSEYAEIAKSTMEAMLTGLPIIVNKRNGKQVKEITESGIILVDNNENMIKKEMEKLINNQNYREEIAKKINKYAWTHFNPQQIENKIVKVYEKVLNG